VVTNIEHVGSTAVPGLAAKPIIDMLVGVRSLSEAKSSCLEPLQALGYTYIPEYESWLPGDMLFRKGVPGPWTHHVHVIEPSSPRWEEYILIRDYLRRHPEIADAYANLKKALALVFDDDIAGYRNRQASLPPCRDSKGTGRKWTNPRHALLDVYVVRVGLVWPSLRIRSSCRSVPADSEEDRMAGTQTRTHGRTPADPPVLRTAVPTWRRTPSVRSSQPVGPSRDRRTEWQPSSRSSSKQADGTPADPATLKAAVPDWRPGDTIPPGRDKTLRVIEIRPGGDPDEDPVRVITLA
jgi:GrpB protein